MESPSISDHKRGALGARQLDPLGRRRQSIPPLPSSAPAARPSVEFVLLGCRVRCWRLLRSPLQAPISSEAATDAEFQLMLAPRHFQSGGRRINGVRRSRRFVITSATLLSPVFAFRSYGVCFFCDLMANEVRNAWNRLMM